MPSCTCRYTFASFIDIATVTILATQRDYFCDGFIALASKHDFAD